MVPDVRFVLVCYRLYVVWNCYSVLGIICIRDLILSAWLTWLNKRFNNNFKSSLSYCIKVFECAIYYMFKGKICNPDMLHLKYALQFKFKTAPFSLDLKHTRVARSKRVKLIAEQGWNSLENKKLFLLLQCSFSYIWTSSFACFHHCVPE